MTLPSDFDIHHMKLSRKFIDQMRDSFIQQYVSDSDTVLDVGNQLKYDLSSNRFNVVTLDITEFDQPDIVADLTLHNDHIDSEQFDAILLTEVLEHVVDPFAAVRELKRILKVGGFLLVTTPLNARIHGPIPDCWRFTQFGLQVLFRDFEIVQFHKLDTPGRNLFPLHYALMLKRFQQTLNETNPRQLTFNQVE